MPCQIFITELPFFFPLETNLIIIKFKIKELRGDQDEKP